MNIYLGGCWLLLCTGSAQIWAHGKSRSQQQGEIKGKKINRTGVESLVTASAKRPMADCAGALVLSAEHHQAAATRPLFCSTSPITTQTAAQMTDL